MHDEVYHQPSLFDAPSKICAHCKEDKPLSEFGRNRRQRDGMAYRCKACNRKLSNEYYQRHPERVRERSRLYHEANRGARNEYTKKWREENPERAREGHIRWREKNPDYQNRPEVRAYYKRYREENKEYYKAAIALWWQEHPEKQAHYDAMKRARKRNAEGEHTLEEFRELCEVFGNRCLCCGRTDASLTRDHVVPLIKGGGNSIANIQPLCRSCNSAKGVNVIDYRGVDAGA